MGQSLLARAQKNGILQTSIFQIRDYAEDIHRTVDDAPFGGGEGMVLKADVMHRCWNVAFEKGIQAGFSAEQTRTVFLSPQGTLLNPGVAKTLASFGHVIFICGHYEGLDERFVERFVDEEISIGDYVLTGGELPALVVADVVSRWIPGVVGNGRSVEEESFEKSSLKYPQYTRPREFEGMEVPGVLLSGDHQAIEAWRSAQRAVRTALRRPEIHKKVP